MPETFIERRAVSTIVFLLLAAGCRQADLSNDMRPLRSEGVGSFGEGRSDGKAAQPLDLVALGQRIYREGLLSSGETVKAVVAGDVAFEGTQFNCVNCHQKSGLGSTEGDDIAPMVTESILYQSKTSGLRKRPSYSDQTLARAIREGVDSGGQRLGELMPRYSLPERDMAALIAYLKELSATVSPGVSDDTLHFATVITEGVDPRPMLDVLETFFRDKNNELRNPRGRRRNGPFYRDNVNLAYRKWKLHRWTLRGPPSTWRRQLEEYYRKHPVFALLSGVSSHGWQPIHDFCEDFELPCLLPNTDLPGVSAESEYTLYFSRGLFLEAGTVATDFSPADSGGRLLQVYPADSPIHEVAATLRRALGGREGVEVFDLVLSADAEATGRLIERQARALDVDAIVLWLDVAEIGRLAPGLVDLRPEIRIYLSASCLRGGEPSLPESLAVRCRLIQPFNRDKDFRVRFQRVALWLRTKGIPVTDRRIMAQTYFACMMAKEVFMHVRYDYYYRDYFLETIDHTNRRLGVLCASHPAPSFGPGQRYISKGCYILGPDREVNGSTTAAWRSPLDIYVENGD